MSEKFHIVSDGSCDLPVELCSEKNITIVPFYVSFDDENYYRENVDIQIRDFYQKMVDDPKTFPKSSMPSVQDFVDAFMPYVEEKKPIVCICITTKFSGSYNSAMNAREMILEDYPDAQIYVQDSTINTVLQGTYVLEAMSLRDSGASFEEACKRLEEIKSSGRIFFTVGSIDYLQHGGRIGKVAGVAGSVLGIKPIIVLKEGEIFAAGVGRSRKKTCDKTIELLLDYLKDGDKKIEDYSLCIGYGYDVNEPVEYRARIIETLAKEGYKLEEKDLPLFQIGATISVHTGPYPLGLTIIEKAIH